MFIKFENEQGECFTTEITQYFTGYGDLDNIDSPRHSYGVTIWRDSDHSEDHILLSRRTYLKYFTKIGSMTSGPWVAFYVMNNDGKTIDSFRIPEQWRRDEDDDIANFGEGVPL